MAKKITFLLTFIFLTLIIFIGVTEAAWCNNDYAKRIDVSVNNSVGSALTEYQVYVNLSSNPINETSMRVYNSTSCTLRPHWTENITNGNSTKLWINYSAVAVSSWTNNTAIYYDNTTASSASNGTRTFEFFDDLSETGGISNPTWKSGKVGNAIYFGVADTWINCGNSTTANLYGAGNLTVDAWIKQTTNAVQDIIYKGIPAGKWGSYTPRSSTDGQALWYQMDDGVSAKNWGGTTDIIDGTWRHVVIVLERNTTGFNRTIYVDGVEDTPTVNSFITTGLFNTTYPLVFGKCTYSGDPSSGTCYNYDGYFDELHLYNRTLNKTEVGWSYARGSTGLASNVSSANQIGYWNFDETSGTTASDSSGNANHGTLNNFNTDAIVSPCDDWTQDGSGTFNLNTTYYKSAPYSLYSGSGTNGDGGHRNLSLAENRILEFCIRKAETDISADFRLWSGHTLTDTYLGPYSIFVDDNNIKSYSDAYHTWQAYSANTWYKISIKDVDFTNDDFDGWVNGVSRITDEGFFLNRDFSSLDVFGLTGVTNSNIWIDNLLIRKYASSEPSSTLGSEENQPSAESTPVISNIQNGSISSTSQYINWTVNQTANNRVLYSNESDLTPAYYSTWDNSTAAPNITLSALTASTQYWYQAWSYNSTNTSLSDNSSTLSFTTMAAEKEDFVNPIWVLVGGAWILAAGWLAKKWGNRRRKR